MLRLRLGVSLVGIKFVQFYVKLKFQFEQKCPRFLIYGHSMYVSDLSHLNYSVLDGIQLDENAACVHMYMTGLMVLRPPQRLNAPKSPAKNMEKLFNLLKNLRENFLGNLQFLLMKIWSEFD